MFNMLPLLLSSEISSFVILALQTLESSLTPPSRSQPMRTKTGSGAAGLCSLPKLASTLTLTSLNYSTRKPSSSCAHSCPSTEWLTGAKREPFLASVRALWYHQLDVMLQATWLHRSEALRTKPRLPRRELPVPPHPLGPLESFRQLGPSF